MEIYGTLGPACNDASILKKMRDHGMTGIRLNLSHVNLNDCKETIDMIHDIDSELKILIDMKGPELRIKALERPLELIDGNKIELDFLPDIVKPYLKSGQEIMLDDGKLLLVVDHELKADVIRGGILNSKKSIALPGIEIKTPALSADDHINLAYAKECGIYGLMQPFVRNQDDLIEIRNAMDHHGLSDCKLLAKIENQSGVDQIENLLPYCDEIVIARGDLGNAVGLCKLPSIQAYLAKICSSKDKPFMVVTQMLDSMQKAPVPTRAEVNDIYHAIIQGASSVMVTAETAIGKYPIEVIKYLSETVKVGIDDLK